MIIIVCQLYSHFLRDIRCFICKLLLICWAEIEMHCILKKRGDGNMSTTEFHFIPSDRQRGCHGTWISIVWPSPCGWHSPSPLLFPEEQAPGVQCISATAGHAHGSGSSGTFGTPFICSFKIWLNGMGLDPRRHRNRLVRVKAECLIPLRTWRSRSYIDKGLPVTSNPPPGERRLSTHTYQNDLFFPPFSLASYQEHLCPNGSISIRLNTLLHIPGVQVAPFQF